MRRLAWGLVVAGASLLALALGWYLTTEIRPYGSFDWHRPDFPWPAVHLGAFMAGVGFIVLAIRRPA
jgi:hypothetical protein